MDLNERFIYSDASGFKCVIDGKTMVADQNGDLTEVKVKDAVGESDGPENTGEGNHAA